jgi:hypothetical protein
VNVNKDAYLDEKKITVRNSGDVNNESDAPKRKRKSWRVRCRVLPRAEWLKSLEQEVISCREYRMRQLKWKFAYATFRTLEGIEF